VNRRLTLLAAAAVAAVGAVMLSTGVFDREGGRARAAELAQSGPLRIPEKPPNIVVIETDDQTVEQMRVLGKTRRFLADQGLTFDNSFVSLSLCCPSRATFLTGQYAHNHGVVSNVAPDGGYRKLNSSRTLPVWLKRAGYTTAFVGKYLNGYGQNHPHRVPRGWMDFHGLLDFQYFNYKMNDNGVLHGYGHKPRAYQTDVFTGKAVRVIRRNRNSLRPLFLWLSYFAPHAGGPHQADGPVGVGVPHPAPRYRYAFDNAPLPRPASFNEADVSDKPPAIRKRPLLTPDEIWNIQFAYQKQLATLLSVDNGVARVVKALQSAGELGNTYIFFTCDNGIFHGEHRIPSGKVLLYEPSIRVPLLVRGPDVRKGIHLDQLVSNVDLAPTILDLAGTTPKGFVMDGRSLVPLFHRPWKEWGRDLLIERLKETGEGSPGSRAHRRVWTYGETGNGDNGNQGRAGTPFDRAYAAIRTPRFIYAEYANRAKEMYDLGHDPQELQNIAGKPLYAGIQRELAHRLDQLRDCAGDSCQRGPRVQLSAAAVGRPASSGRCQVSHVRASVSGPDSRWIKSVRFFSDGRLRALMRAKPYATSFWPTEVRTPGKRAARVRARIRFVDGRKLDRIRSVPVLCR
jgi:N-acetylglucosamine-6-sulfatase